ncbi:MAG: hypothetical protein ACLGG9_10560 [Thermoleophilia bacterium]|jgi:hypothetical protein
MHGGLTAMPGVVAEASLVARLADRDLPGLRAIERPRRRGRWAALDPDATAVAVADAGPGALVLARPPAADRGAAAVWVLARAMGREVLRLPHADGPAAWVVGCASRVWPGTGDREMALRALQVLSGTVSAGRCGPGAGSPAGPRALTAWAGRAWRGCADCPGGGLPGAPCGRCGSLVDPVSP